MKARNLTKMFALALLLALASPALASHPDAITNNEATKAVQLEQRLEAIRAMDKSALSVTEKKALRKEVKEIKKEMAVTSGGIYLSVGAALLIALLLILLL